jgi:hypothetical protein
MLTGRGTLATARGSLLFGALGVLMPWSVGSSLGPAFGRDSAPEAPAFDHARWDRILKAVVDEAGWVDYRQLTERWAGELRAYLAELRAAQPEKLPTDADRIAFWINAYNAVCVQKLLDHKLPAEVPHAKIFGKNIFTERTYEVAGKVRSLDDIEHGILRRQFKENRIHAAVVCGASSCPRLRPEAYSGPLLDRQLDEECRSWLQEEKTKKGERKNHFDQKAGIYYVSKIFDWYEADFGGGTAGVLAFVSKHSSEADREFLARNKVKLRYLTYDWALNSRP